MNEYAEITGEAPNILCFGLAALTEFYMRSGKANDSEEVIKMFADMQSDDDLTVITNVIKYYNITDPQVKECVCKHYFNIQEKGILAAVQEAVNG